MGMCVSTLEKAKVDKPRVMESPEKDKSTVSGELLITGVGLSSQRLPRHLVSTVRNHDSKEETFFDSQPWLNSDSEDDFVSVNDDFTPSRGSTPVHPSLSKNIPSLNNALIGENPLGFNSKLSPAGKKRSLVELFRDSIRISSDHTDEHKVWSKNETVTNEDVEIIEKKKKNVQCCIPRMLSGRRSYDGNKKTCSPPAFSTY